MSLAELERLTGPADFNRDRWGRPLIVPAGGGKPVAYTRASSAAKPIEENFNLELWKQRNAVYGVATDPSLVARVLAVGGRPHEWSDSDKKKINQIVNDAADVAQAHRAANIGTALHAIIEKINRNEPAGDVGMFQADIDAYQQAIAQLRWTINPDYVECRLACDELKIAGTCDLIPWTDHGYAIADLKTGASITYGALAYSAQLACYAHSELYHVENDSRSTLDIDRKTGYLIHLPAGQGVCTIYTVDLVAGFEAVVLANQVRAIQKAAKGWLSAVDLSTSPNGTAADGLVDNLRTRVRTLVDLGHQDKLVWRWPEGVPGFKTDHTHTLDELERIERALVAIETEVEAPLNPPPLPAKPPKAKRQRPPAKPVIDEGGEVTDEKVAALIAAIKTLDRDDQFTLKLRAGEANDAGYPISLEQDRSQRRWLIAEALRRWCEFGWDHEVVAAALDYVDAPHGDTLGARIGQLTMIQAAQLGDIADALVDESLVIKFTPNPTISTPERNTQ